MSKEIPQMTAQDVVEIVQLLAQHSIELCIDGGWGVDALLGEQTRPHSDLDIAVPHHHVEQIRALLQARGYRDVPRDDTWECNFVLGDEQGRQIDIHSYTFDDQGRCVHGVPYPADSLTGSGLIAGYPVRCVPPAWMVQFHTGYPLDENDYHDVRLLCKRFNIPLPKEYHKFL